MATLSHLRFINPDYKSYELSSFHLFPLLPKELRLKIWRHALERQRIIKVLLKFTFPKSQRTDSVDLSKPGSECYCPVVDGYQLYSNLLRVSQESRDETLKFYRVHLPCRFTKAEKWEALEPFRGRSLGREEIEERTSTGTLYFNPEYDFLHIIPEFYTKETLIEFICHLRTTYDPRRIGLRNLAMNLNDLNANDLFQLQPSDLQPEVRRAFKETITGLYEVFFVENPRVGRQVLGILSGLPTSDTMFNRSFPIMAMPPAFDRLCRDPRPITQDLKQIYTGMGDTRHMLHLFHRNILKKFDVDLSQMQTQYQLLLSFDPMAGGHQIADRHSAAEWLRKEDDQWTDRSKWPPGANREKFQNENLEDAVRPAFGFWLFPMEALGPYPEQGVSEEQGYRRAQNTMVDLRAHWPELALMNLP